MSVDRKNVLGIVLFVIFLFIMLVGSWFINDMFFGYQLDRHTEKKFEGGVRARTFEYEGHRYIVFDTSKGATGVVHDPECQLEDEIDAFD